MKLYKLTDKNDQTHAGCQWGENVTVETSGKGDLCDRGPRILDTVRVAHNMIESDGALCVPGNHDMKLLRKLRGRDVQITHGLDRTLSELDAAPDEERDRFKELLDDSMPNWRSHRDELNRAPLAHEDWTY